MCLGRRPSPRIAYILGGRPSELWGAGHCSGWCHNEVGRVVEECFERPTKGCHHTVAARMTHM